MSCYCLLRIGLRVQLVAAKYWSNRSAGVSSVSFHFMKAMIR